jgi:hypothetical protein
MAQTIILGGKLAALGGEPCLFGALGIAFGPDLDQDRAPRGEVVRQRLGGRAHGPIGPCNRRLVTSLRRGESFGRSSSGHLGSRTPRRVHPSPVIVIPVLTQHYVMLQRNLLYTGVTRGRRLIVLVGQKKAVAIAVRNVSGRRRWSKLDEWLAARKQR